MKEPTDNDILRAMTRYGGNFVKWLASAARYADSENLAKIKATWPEYWATYREFAIKNSEKGA
jgi:hypothetical protein